MSRGKILIVGRGAREHALAWRGAHEGFEVIVAPGNEGIARHARLAEVDAGDHQALVELATREQVDAVIIGPEQPLVDGLADALRDAGVPTVGPSAKVAELEGSKAVAKAFMARHRIPTAVHKTVTSVAEGLDAIRSFSRPPVVKACGLAAGKGVVVAETFAEAEAALRDCIDAKRFGEAGAEVVLEERLLGQEVSFFVLTDGEGAVTFAPCQDHKRIFEGDAGPNTGGMGAYAPAPVFTEAVHQRVTEQIVRPTLAGLRAEGTPFVGILFVGLMIDETGAPKVIEYNVRLGDPEAQPLMFGLDGSVMDLFVAVARGELVSSHLASRPAVSVVLASEGYPGHVRKGVIIEGLEPDGSLLMEDVMVFHAGTRRDSETGAWLTNGGRVLGICARGETLAEATSRAYDAMSKIELEGGQFRRDIAARAL